MEEDISRSTSDEFDTIRLDFTSAVKKPTNRPSQQKINRAKKTKQRRPKPSKEEPDPEALLQDAAEWLESRLASTFGCRSHRDGDNNDNDNDNDDDTIDLSGMVELWNTYGVPDVLSSSKMLSKEMAEVPVNWKAALSDSEPPSRLLLSSSEHIRGSTTVAFDIDSFIAHAQSLAIFKMGLRFTIDAPIMHNIQKNIHVRINGKALHKTPHMLLGRCRTEESFRLYVVFPNMVIGTEEGDIRDQGQNRDDSDQEDHSDSTSEQQPQPRRRTGSYTMQDERQRFTDELLLPALEDVCPAYMRHHYPFGYVHGRDKTLARNTEGRNLQHARREAISILIRGEFLDAMWSFMVQLTRRPTLSCFRGMFLVVNCKNSKLAYQSETFQEARQLFMDDINMHMDLAKLNTVQSWVDVGRELAPDSERRPKTFLWRTCCLQRWYRSFCQQLSDGSSSGGGRNAQGMLYGCHMLRDAGSMTVDLAASNPLRKGGIIYAQRYNTMKGLFDAQGTYPFTNPAVEGVLVPQDIGDLWKIADRK